MGRVRLGCGRCLLVGGAAVTEGWFPVLHRRTAPDGVEIHQDGHLRVLYEVVEARELCLHCPRDGARSLGGQMRGMRCQALIQTGGSHGAPLRQARDEAQTR